MLSEKLHVAYITANSSAAQLLIIVGVDPRYDAPDRDAPDQRHYDGFLRKGRIRGVSTASQRAAVK